MTVAAVVIAPHPEMALAPHEGRPLVRRLADVAWSGGAIPFVVVVPDPEGAVAAALRESAALLAVPEATRPQGIAWFTAGFAAARGAVEGTRAALLWPARHAWLDPETVTSLIEAHGRRPDALVRPAYRGRVGLPALVPVAALERLESMAGRNGEDALAALVEAGLALEVVELGDPGIVHDLATPREALPPFEGPVGPVGGPAPEWGADVAAHLPPPESDRAPTA